MEIHPRAAWVLILFPVFLAAVSCRQLPPAPPKPGVYYISPVITYLKECPAYDCQVAGELYQGDRVEQLEVKDNWWRVKAARGGLTGWLQAELLSSSVITPEVFYVAADLLELRECAGPDCPFRRMLQKGDRLQKIDQTDHGWLKVLVEKDAGIGWVPAQQVSDKAVAPAKPEAGSGEKAFLYAAHANVNLYSLPLFSSKVLKAISLNEKVEKLAVYGEKWFKVRHLASGAEGWAAVKDLNTGPVAVDPPKPKRKFRKKPPPPKPQPEEAPLEPEAM